MTEILGIIPAGGRAKRFNGIPKELLPVDDKHCGLTRCIQAMRNGGATKIFVGSAIYNYGLHRAVSKDVIIEPRNYRGMWEVITTAQKQQADYYFFAMPDTVFNIDAFNITESDISCGTFITDEPNRFGIIVNDYIYEKPAFGGEAWGLWIWSNEAMKHLSRSLKDTFDLPISLNNTIERFGLNKFPLKFYYDFANFGEYRKYLCSME